MKWKQILLIVAISSVSAVGSVALYNKFYQNQEVVVGEAHDKLPANYAKFLDSNGNPAEAFDFTKAASTAVPAVVHIKTKIPARKITNDLPGLSYGEAMPLNRDPLDPSLIELIRLWILGDGILGPAPETGWVAGTDQ